MAAPSGQSCANCTAYIETSAPQTLGLCCYNPPIMNTQGQAVWPPVFEDDWCWHWELIPPSGNQATVDLSVIGAIAAAPTSGTVACSGSVQANGWFVLTFSLSAARVPITVDGGGLGSYGGLELFNFVDGVGITFISAHHLYTSIEEIGGISASGDAEYEFGWGSTVINTPADGIVTGTDADLIDDPLQITNTGGNIPSAETATGMLDAAGQYGNPKTINMNISGTVASVINSGSMDVTGTVLIFGTWSTFS